MTTPGGDQVDIPELLRQHGREAIYKVVEQLGLKKAGDRIQCPFHCCSAKGPDRALNVRVFQGKRGTWKLWCHSGGFEGDLLDLLEQSNRWSKAEAIAHLKGTPVPTRPALRVVPSAPAENPEKLKPAEVRRVWDMLAVDDELGRLYLEGRGLAGSPLLRFATETSADNRVKRNAGRGYRLAMLLTDVVGNQRGVQFRLVREPQGDESKQLYLKGSDPSGGGGAFFGAPELIEASPVVAVAEGMADTAALHQWVSGAAGVTVIGSPGKDALHRVAEALRSAGIALAGKVFALFPQNDRPANKSRACFKRLAQLLGTLGATVVWCNTPPQFDDVAQWRHESASTEWPPLELARAFSDVKEPGEDREPVLVRPAGSAIAAHAEYRTDRYGQDTTSLLALLDDPAHREAALGKGMLELSEMTETPLLNGVELSPSDTVNLVVRLEAMGLDLTGKRLKFEKSAIADAIHFLASRNRVHPVRDWLCSLRSEGRGLLEDGLPQAFGHEPHTFHAHLLRKWFLCAAARGMRPGCKMENVLVLVGPQGCGKSRFCEAMGGPWFTANKVRVDDDNGKRLMRRNWIIEWGELDSMKRAKDQEQIKAFLSTSTDTWKPLWREALINAPRHSLIIGTSNRRDFLRDPTGSRRFWVVPVEKVDVAWCTAHREQLFAEGAAAVTAGEQWWLDNEMEKELAAANKNYEYEDELFPIISDFLEQQLGVDLTISTVMHKALGLDAEAISRAGNLGSRIGTIMEELGWHATRPRVDGKRSVVWVKGGG